MPPDPRSLEDIRLGEKVRRLRVKLGLTLRDVATATGLSQGLLSQVENNNITPPIATLLKISNALDVPISHFFLDEGGPPVNYSILRRHDRENLRREGDGVTYRYEPLITQMENRAMNPFFVRFTPHFPPETEMYRHEGEEFWHFIRGRVEFRLAEELFLFEAGDSLYFEANVPHAGRRLGEEEAEAIAVLFTGRPPSGQAG